MKLNPEKTPLCLVLRIRQEGTFGHIVGHVETPTREEERAARHLPYGHLLEVVTLWSQCSEGQDHLYGYEVRAGTSCDQLSEYDLEKRLKVLRPINRALERMGNELGAPLSYGQWVSRVAIAIGAKSVVIARMQPAHNGTMWQSGAPGSMVYQIDHTARELVAWVNRNVPQSADRPKIDHGDGTVTHMPEITDFASCQK